MIDRGRVIKPLAVQMPWQFSVRHRVPLSFWQYSPRKVVIGSGLIVVVLTLLMVTSANGASITKIDLPINNTSAITVTTTTTPTITTNTAAKISTQITTASDKASTSSRNDGVGPDGRRPDVNSEQPTVENLVKQWAPLVWLAPSEQFMPGNVNEFLSHVHTEKLIPVAAGTTQHQSAEILDVSDDVLLYELDREIGVSSQSSAFADGSHHSDSFDPSGPPQRSERRVSFGIDLPVGMKSRDWFLVTNLDIDLELLNRSSFLYGQDPNKGNVPIYSTISTCNSFESSFNSHLNEIGYSERIDRNPFIPISASQVERFPYKFETPVSDQSRLKRMPRQAPLKKELTAYYDTPNTEIVPMRQKSKVEKRKNRAFLLQKKKPHFQVTYWMFYPYNQGKTICTLNLGPLGKLPIPVIFGKCLGTRRDFGSHVGDWEHMTLFFRGRNEPEEMYVSAHDAGAYYLYDRLSGSFEFRRQETRKGILQHPNFPKTVRTINNHPVLFSAQGSHGLWTAPGKHRFVRLPRLVDINGFGTPWYTWKNIEFSYDTRDHIGGRARSLLGPQWLQFMGKWGNPKSKCHPLKRLGLNFCEYNDGPTGIPMKELHFNCK